MRYIITKNNVSQQEIKARMEYIYELFHIYTLEDNVSSKIDITCLKTFPEKDVDLLMIVGHDIATDRYIRENYKNITENNVVVLTCNTSKFSSLKLLKDKNIFLPKNGRTINFYDGVNYGFNFDITDEEIIFYRNRKEKLEKMLNNTFERMIIK